MHLVHLWLVEITCRLECISAAAKWSPGRQMRPIKRSGDPDIPNYRSDWRIEKFSCQSPCPNFWLSKYTVLVSIYFYVGQSKIIADHPGYHLGGPLGDPGFFVSCSTGACMMWCHRVTQICDCNSNVSVPWTWRLLRHAWLQSCISWQKCHWSNYCDDEFSLSNQITSVGIYIFAKSFEIDYFANVLPYKYKTQHYQQRQVWYRNASLGGPADRCAQAEFMEDNRVVTSLTLSQCTLAGPVYTEMPLECHWLTQCTLGYHWVTQRILAGYTGTPLEKLSWNSPTLDCHWLRVRDGTVSMAMHCLGYNKLTPEGSLANHIFDAAVAVAVFYTRSEAFFFGFATPHYCAPLETIPV